MQKNKDSLLYLSFIVLIIAVSFYYLSPLTSYVFHSDIAIQVLMTYDFRWPEDVYYWGQDRLGSIVPAFGHLLYQCFHFSPVVCASLSEYFFLILGFLSFSTLFKTTFSKLIFAVAWFLPLLAFQELIQLSQPYGEQACFLGLTVYFMNKWMEKESSGTKSLLFFSCAIVSVFISIWISDASVVAYVLLLPLIIQFIRKEPKERIILFTGVFLLISCVGFYFIHFAKNVHPKEDDYSSHFFIAGNELFSIVGQKLTELYHTLIFEDRNVLYSWHAVFFMVGLTMLCYFLFTRKEKQNTKMTWRNYFLVYTILCAFILFSSYWVSKNFSGNRYFTILYVSIWIVVLISLENLENRKKRVLQSIFLLSALFSAASSIAPHYMEGRSEEKFNRLEGFKELGRIGVIGSYWRSYYIAAADPENIVATTCEAEKPRCRECIDSVMARPTIYLIQENWLDSLPVQIWQYGKELVRTGEPRNIGGLMTAPYTIKMPK